MPSWLSGPEARNAARSRLRELDAHVTYAYVEPHGDGYRKAPEYEARYIRLSAFHIRMHTALDALADALSATPNVVDVERVENHPTLRPLVRVIIDRQPT